MGKALLMAIIVASVAIPMWTARDRSPARGARRTTLYFAVFVAVWAYALLHLFAMLKD